MGIFSTWWVWIAAGIVLAILETLLPAFILLGFALGAIGTGLLMALGVVVSPSMLILTFAVLSLFSWLLLRQFFQLKTGSVKTFDHDINDT